MSHFLCITLLFVCTLLSACNQTESKQLKEIQTQLQLLTTEVVRLQEQVDKLSASQYEPPSKAITELDVDVSSYLTRIGNKDAQYVIIEFMDYQCPYCLRHANQVLPELKRKYIDSGLVQYVIHDFPLEFHAQAENAALAARCAAHQGKFLGMHKELTNHSSPLSDSVYFDFAKQQKLNLSDFTKCWERKKERQHIREGLKDALKMGVSGTPRFIIARVKDKRLLGVQVLSGAQPISAFEELLKQVFLEHPNVEGDL